MTKEAISVPNPAKRDKVLTIHDDSRVDPYYWMNERENPDVKEYLEEENAYTAEVLKDTKDLQEEIYQEIISRINPNEITIPYELNGYIYQAKYEEGKEYPIHLRKLKGSETAEVILDVNELAEGHEYYDLSGLTISPDNKWMAYGVDTLSRRIYTIYFKNLETGEVLEEKIENTTGNCTWAGDSKSLYYATKDETLRADKIWRYTRGEKDSHSLIYEEKDDTFICYVYKSQTREYIIIGSYASLSQEFRILKADDVGGEFKVFQERQHKLEYDISHAGGDKFYVMTNKDAVNFRLMECTLEDTSLEAWKEVIPHREKVLIEDVEVFEDYIVLSERVKGLSKVRVIGRNNPSLDYYLEADDEVYLMGTTHNAEFAVENLTIFYQSMVQPPIFYSYNMRTGNREIIKEKIYPGYDKTLYDTERVWAIAEDGTKIPMSISFRKGMERNGDNPLLLYGYGSYGNSIEPSFSAGLVSLLDRGFIFVRTHIRGGSEMGRYWYDSGKLLDKKNTFTDFIACAKTLIEKKYTNPDKLMALGGSAGGLLIGAVINMAPELFKAVIAAVPFVDVVTTMLDTNIPLTTGEYDEWGNPNIKEYYDYIKSYSPYDNVTAQSYPAMLVTTGFHDSQVQYWEPAKWVARIRDFNTGKAPILLYTNMGAGHSGTTGRYKIHKETAMEYAFLVAMVDKKF